MKPGMKMLMLAEKGERNIRPLKYEPEDNYPRMHENWRMEEPESRRRRDSRGRFRSDWDGDIYWAGDINEPDRKQDISYNYPNRPFPVYRNKQMRGGDEMRQIGFAAGPEEIRTKYGMDAAYHTGDEMEHRQSMTMGGYGRSEGSPMTREMAEEWTRNMHNEDGTKGPHWTMEQVKQVMAQKGIKYDPVEFYAILNAMYSDYCAVMKKHNVNNIDMYVALASAWLNDSDAVPNKAAMYYECIVQH